MKLTILMDKAHNKQKFRLLILLIILLLVASSAFILYKFITPKKSSNQATQKTETFGWKTYENKELDFSFKYPADWVANKKGDQYGTLATFRSPQTQKLLNEKQIDPGYSFDLVVSYWSSINNFDAMGGSWVGAWSYINLEDYFTDTQASKRKIKEVILDDQKAYLVSIGGAGSNLGIMAENKGIYQLSFETHSNDNGNNKLTDTETQIISTFKFNIDISDWKTYKNKDLGFSFNYPSKYQLQEKTGDNYYSKDSGNGIALELDSSKLMGCAVSRDFGASRGADSCEYNSIYSEKIIKNDECLLDGCEVLKSQDENKIYFAKTTSWGEEVLQGFVPLHDNYKLFTFESTNTSLNSENELKQILSSVRFIN